MHCVAPCFTIRESRSCQECATFVFQEAFCRRTFQCCMPTIVLCTQVATSSNQTFVKFSMAYQPACALHITFFQPVRLLLLVIYVFTHPVLPCPPPLHRVPTSLARPSGARATGSSSTWVQSMNRYGGGGAGCRVTCLQHTAAQWLGPA